MHPAPQRSCISTLACLALALVACGEGSTGPGRDEPGVRAVLGAGVTDTIDAQQLQALVVEVRGPAGRVASGVLVRFEAQPPADTTRRGEPAVYVCALTAPVCGSQFLADTTDADGRANAIVRMGRVAGRAVVRIVVPELGMADSATFMVTPGAPVRVRAAAADTGLDIGGTATLRGRVVDRYNNTRPEVPTIVAGAGSALTVDPATGVVTGREMGTQWLFVRHGTSVDSTSVRVVPQGRLVVWSSNARVVRLVNLNGSGPIRTLVSNVSSDLGTFPHFDAMRQHVTLHTGTNGFGGTPNNVIVVDTTGTIRRDLGPTSAFTAVITTRQLADGTVLVVGQRAGTGGYAIWRVGMDNAVASMAALPGFGATYGGADISHDGTRVAYIVGSELRVLNLTTGIVSTLDASARSPRWSAQGDRLAFLVPSGGSGFDGVAAIVNANGTGRRVVASGIFSPGLAWSPDGAYLVGRASEFGASALRLLRVSDGAAVLLRFRAPAGFVEDYFQPDWG